MTPLFSMFFLSLVVVVGCSAEVGENDKADIAVIEFDPDSIEIDGDLGSFVPVNPSANYPMITSSTPKKAIVGLYNDMVVPLKIASYKRIDIVNGKAGPSVVLDLDGNLGRVATTTYDCLGRLQSKKSMTLGKGIHKFNVPPSGLLMIEKT